MRLLYFNPENDLALAANDPHYTPPASARQMASDLREFPRLWVANELTSKASLGDDLAPVIWCEREEEGILLWGWSPLAVHQLRTLGVADELLPNDEQLASYRNFASRKNAARLLRIFQERWPQDVAEGLLVGESCWCRTEEAVRMACERYGSAMLKMPWSGSGRGVRPVGEDGLNEKDLFWVLRTLQRQGGVEVEPKYIKVQDCAMEFWAEGGLVRYEGLSVFETTAGGVYAGNLVAPEEVKEARLAQFIPTGLLHEVRLHLVELLSEAGLPTWYTGPLGVDMMIVENMVPSSSETSPSSSGTLHPRYALHPLVEINLRMTMGWVALQLQRKLHAGEVGTFKIQRLDGRYSALFIKKGV